MSENFHWISPHKSTLPAFITRAGQGKCSLSFQGWCLIYTVSGSCDVLSGGQSLQLTPQTAAWAKNAAISCTDGSILYACIGGSSTDILTHRGRLDQNTAIEVRDIVNSIVCSARLGILDDVWKNSSVAYDGVVRCCAVSKHPTQYPALVQDAAEIIKDRYPFLLGVEDVAELLGVSKHHLIRLFSHHMGTSPGQFLKEERLKNAAALLQSGRYSVKEAAAMVGYEGDNYFCKVFKARFGISPGQFRGAKPLEQLSVIPKEEIFYL